MNTKKFITGLGLSTEITNFLLKGNLTDFSIFNIEKKDAGIVSFMTVTDFHKVEALELTPIEQGIWELFMQFNNAKNATACLLKALEDKKPITDETFNLQTKITPKEYKPEHKAVKSYSEFIALMTPEQKTALEQIARDYAIFAGFETTNFDFQFVNGENGLELEAGQHVRFFDPIYGQKVYSKVFQASPKGLVTLLEEGGTFTLSAETAKSIEILADEATPAGVKEYFNELVTDEMTKIEERKTMKLERAEKIADAQALKAKADAEKAEKAALKLKADKIAEAKSQKAMEKLQKLPMDTKENCDKLVDKINKAIDLIPAHKKALSAEIKTALTTIKENAKKKPETAPEAPKNDIAPEEAPIIAGSRKNRPKRQNKTIEATTPAEATPEQTKIEL